MSHGWFGKPWGAGGDAPVCADPSERVETPVGVTCLWCETPITEDQSGVVTPYMAVGHNAHMGAVHVECHLRQVIGGVHHIEGRCTCCGGDEDPDPPGLTNREAAIAAVAAFERKTGESILR